MNKQWMKCPNCEREGLHITESGGLTGVVECKFCHYTDMAAKSWADHKWHYPVYQTWEELRTNLREQNNQAEKSPKRKNRLRLRFQIFKRDKYHCQLCGRGAEDGVKIELGHKTARARGGKDTSENLIALCFDCNRGMYTEEP